jgi:hypothetical protein
MLQLADEGNGRAEDGTYAAGLEARFVIRCASGLNQVTPRNPATVLAELQQLAPRMSQFYDLNSFFDPTCGAMVGHQVTPFVPSYSGPAPILVIGGLNDPATPYRWANELVARMGPSARLLTYGGEGHGYMLDSTCVGYFEGAIVGGLAVPPSNTMCDTNPPVPRPAALAQLASVPGVSAPFVDPVVISAFGYGPPRWYTEVRTFTGDDHAVLAQFVASLTALGYTVNHTYATEPGTTRLDLVAKDGSKLRLEVVSPAGLQESERDQMVDQLTPDGVGYVILGASATLG